MIWSTRSKFSTTALRTYEWWIYEIWPPFVGQNSSFKFVFLVCFFLGGWGVNLSKHIISLKIKYLYMKNKKRNLKNLKWILKCLLRNSFSRYDECDHCRKKLNFFPAKSHNRHIRMNHIVQTSMLLSVWYVWWRWIEYASLICNMVWMNCAWIIPSAFHIICQMSDVLIFPLHNVLV